MSTAKFQQAVTVAIRRSNDRQKLIHPADMLSAGASLRDSVQPIRRFAADLGVQMIAGSIEILDRNARFAQNRVDWGCRSEFHQKLA